MQNLNAKLTPLAAEGATSRPKRSILVMLLLVFFAFSFYKLVLVDRMGFCYKRLWFVSSEELILNTIDGLMKSGLMKLDAADSSPQAYLARHPDCCDVTWGEGLFGSGLTYFGSAQVTVIYELSEAGKKYYRADSKERYYEFIEDCTACGESVGYTGSTTIAPIGRKPTSNQ